MDSGTRLVVWRDGIAFHKDMPLVAGAGAGIAFARKSEANTHFALNAQGGNDKSKSRVGGMCSCPHDTRFQASGETAQQVGQDGRLISVKLDREKEATLFPFRTHVCVEGDAGKACANPQKPCCTQTRPKLILVGQMWGGGNPL